MKPMFLTTVAAAALLATQATAGSHLAADADAEVTMTETTVPLLPTEGETEMTAEGDTGEAETFRTETEVEIADENQLEDGAGTGLTAQAPILGSDVVIENGPVTGIAMDDEANPLIDTEADVEPEMAELEATDGIYGTFASAAVRDLVGMNVLAMDGDDVGEVEALVRTAGDVSAIVGVGGFLGLGEHDVAIPLSEFTMSDGALMLPGMTEDQVEAMAEYEGDADELPLTVTVAGDPID